MPCINTSIKLSDSERNKSSSIASLNSLAEYSFIKGEFSKPTLIPNPSSCTSNSNLTNSLFCFRKSDTEIS